MGVTPSTFMADCPGILIWRSSTLAAWKPLGKVVKNPSIVNFLVIVDFKKRDLDIGSLGAQDSAMPLAIVLPSAACDVNVPTHQMNSG